VVSELVQQAQRRIAAGGRPGVLHPDGLADEPETRGLVARHELLDREAIRQPLLKLRAEHP